MAKRGRKPTPEAEKQRIIAHILGELSTGRPVSRTCREDDGLCNAKTFWRWYFDEDELRQKVARARECGIEAKMDEAMNVAETPMMGETVTIERDPEHQKDLDDGAEITGHDGSPYEGMIVKVRKEDMLGHRRLLIDTIHKQAQMLKPKTYGLKLDLTSDGKALGLSDAMRAAEKRLSDGEE